MPSDQPSEVYGPKTFEQVMDEFHAEQLAAYEAQRDRSLLPARERLPRVAPIGWHQDLWSEFRAGVIYEDEVPRDLDGEPLFDMDGRPR